MSGSGDGLMWVLCGDNWWAGAARRAGVKRKGEGYRITGIKQLSHRGGEMRG